MFSFNALKCSIVISLNPCSGTINMHGMQIVTGLRDTLFSFQSHLFFPPPWLHYAISLVVLCYYKKKKKARRPIGEIQACVYEP